MKNLFVRLLAVVALIVAAAMPTTAQESFAYQAVIRNAEGELMTNQDVTLKFSLLNGGKTQYAETQKAKANQYGNISVMIGAGEKTEGDFAKVPWNTLDITLKVEVKPAGSDKFIELGQTKINPVPYAMYAAQGGGAATVKGAAKGAETLFEVNDREGRPVFAVTNDGIVVYVDDQDDSKVRRSGFLIVGRDATKGESGKEYFSVTADGTQINVDDENSDKLRRSGFLITGRDATKEGSTDYLSVDGNGTTVYVDANSDDKLRRSGFLITGRDATKDGEQEMFSVDGGQTTVYVDDLGDGKVRRSGFLIVGRDATKDGANIVDITGSRTNLTTATLSIANGAIGEDGSASTALQLTEETVTMNTDMAMEGGVRPVLDVDKNEEYNVYISDNEDDCPTGFDGVYVDGDFYFRPSEMMEGGYDWLASFHDTLVVPLASQEGFLMLNGEGEETAIPQDAYVVVSNRNYGRVDVWPLRELKDFKVNFALSNYYKSSGYVYGGSSGGDEYARFNVTINSKEAYPSCRLRLGGQHVFTAMVKTSQGTFNVETGGGNFNKEFQIVFGETVTLAVTKVPDGQVFDSWRCNGRRYTDSELSLPITQLQTEIYPVFKDLSPVLWVDNTYKPESENVVLDGTVGLPYKTVADALKRIIDEDDNTLRGFRINVLNAENKMINIGDSLDNHATHITIDFIAESVSERRIAGITASTSVPVIVRDAQMFIDEETPSGGNIVKLSGNRLTLENCAMCNNPDNPLSKRGLYVEKGELVAISTEISYCTAGDDGLGGGAYVETGATLSLKNGTDFVFNTAQKGFGIYLCAGATLNVSNSSITTNTPSEDIKDYEDVYAAGECSFNVSGQSQIGKVGLGDGAYVTRNIEGVRKPGKMEFISIENPNKKVVKVVGLSEQMQQDVFESDMDFNKLFEITNYDLITDGYSSHLKFDGNIGKPFKTQKVYSRGTIIFLDPEEADVSYTYYRGDDDEEYLRLKYIWDGSDYECHDYWLLGDKVYCDTIQAIYGLPNAIANADDFNAVFDTDDYSWPEDLNNYSFDRTDDFRNLLTVNTTGYTLDAEGSIIDSENKPIASLNKGILINCTSKDLFGSILPGFRSLIQRSICFEGRNLQLSNAEIDQWISEDYPFFFGDDVNYKNSEIETGDDDFRSYSLQYIEEHFRKLRKGFDVTIMALGDTVTVTDENNNSESYTGIVHLENVAYNTKLTLSVDENDENFIGWDDDNTDRARDFFIRGDVDIFPLFRQTDFTVSANGPYKSFDLINKIIEKSCDERDNVTIHVLGTVRGSQTLSDNIIVNSITIDGADYANPSNPNGVLDARKQGRVLTINTTSDVIIRNLTITGGKAYENFNEEDDNNFGGGIMMTAGTKVTLGAGAVVGKAAVTNVPTEERCANIASLRGGGIYNDGGRLTLSSGSMVSYNYIAEDIYGSSTVGGGGIFSHGGEVIVESGASVVYNFSNSRGGGIHLDAGAKLTSSGNIDNNVAVGYGGGVMFATYDENETDDNVLNLYATTTFTMEGGSVSNNKTTYTGFYEWHSRGGGIFIDGGGTVTIKTGSVINNNSAAYESGAIDITIGTLDLQGGTITGNSIISHESDKRKGGAIRMSSNTTFKISGDVSIPCTGVSKNDVYLEDGAKITITGELTRDYVATITPASYNATTQMFDGGDEFVAAAISKFALTPYDANHSYYINSFGKLLPSWMVEADGHYYVELGTSKTKWATTNVESDTPYEPGGYYRWGLPTSDNSGFTLNNYNNYANSGIDHDLGNYQQDPARKQWGNNWVMPSKTQFDNLKTECYWEWTNDYNGENVKGFIVYNPKEGSSDAGTVSLSANSNYVLADAHIFLPAAGYYDGNTKSNESSSGHYWTLTYYSSQYAYYMNFSNSGSVTTDLGYRYRGLTVRPVRRE